MKILHNNSTSIIDGEKAVDYATLIKAVAGYVNPKEGIKIDEMSKKLRIHDIADKGGKKLEFEDADFALLKQLIQNHQWAVVHKDLIQLQEDINAL